MSVIDDKFWCEVAAVLRSAGLPAARVIGPAEFAELVPGIVSYKRCRALVVDDVAAVVVHKGLLDEIDAVWLKDVATRFRPIFANEVFVVLRPGATAGGVLTSPHYQSFLVALRKVSRSRVQDSAGREAESSRPSASVVPPARMAIYLGDHRALTKTVHGYKMFVDTHDVSLTPHILLDGTWEPWITDIFVQLVRPGMIVVDVGANVGYYTLLAAGAVGAAGRVHSFEPQLEVAEFLYANVAVNGFTSRCEIVTKAVLEESKRVAFHRFRKHKGSAGLWASEADAASFHDSIEKVEVDALALDGHFPPGTRIDLLKIDAEGAEPFILKGAQRILRDNRAIQIVLEFAPSLLERSSPNGDGATRLYELLVHQGFRAHRITTSSTLQQVALDELLSHEHCDVLFTRA